MRALTWLVLIGVLVTGTAPALAREDYYLRPSAPASMVATAPIGFSQHCLMHAEDCQPGGNSVVLKSSQLMSQLKAVNNAVNPCDVTAVKSSQSARACINSRNSSTV